MQISYLVFLVGRDLYPEALFLTADLKFLALNVIKSSLLFSTPGRVLPCCRAGSQSSSRCLSEPPSSLSGSRPGSYWWETQGRLFVRLRFPSSWFAKTTEVLGQLSPSSVSSITVWLIKQAASQHMEGQEAFKKGNEITHWLGRMNMQQPLFGQSHNGIIELVIESIIDS